MIIDLGYTPAQAEVFFENQDAKFKLVPKGRRLGFTRGSSQACIEFMLDRECKILWGDTIHDNIIKYVERYWLPVLNKNKILFNWNQQRKEMRIGNSICDFRSSDNPDNWEGFGYNKIFLNEAGIILRKDYLWYNAVLPMLLDFPDSQCIIGGTPKGKLSVYWDLQQRALAGERGFWSKTYTSYDNPLLSIAEIDEMKKQMPSSVVQQEIYGEFVDPTGAIMRREWIQMRDVDYTQLDVVMGVDLAISTKTSADYTAIVVGCQDKEGNLFIIDAFRDRLTFNETKKKIIEYAERYNVVKVGIEQVAYQAAMVQELVRTTKLPVRKITPKDAGGGDKVTRFLNLATRYEHGYVFHSRNLIPEFERELVSFTGSRLDDHDDFVDAATYMYFLAKKPQSKILAW